MSIDVAQLATRSQAMRAAVAERIAEAIVAGRPTGGVRLFAEGITAINAKLPSLERATRSVVYNMQPIVMFDPLRREREPNRHTRVRRIRGHMIAAPTLHLSLVAACHPDTWIGPAQAPGLAVDEGVALFPGPLSAAGRPTAWLCDHRDLVEQFCELWEQTKELAVPIRDVPGVIPLSERQLDVVSLLSRGAKDATIARLLGVSARTVTGDVSRILDALHVDTRWQAGIVLGRATFPN